MPRLGSRVRVPFSALLIETTGNIPVLFSWKVYAQVAELVDAHVSGACAARRAGSSPVLGTQKNNVVKSRRGGGIGRRATLRG